MNKKSEWSTLISVATNSPDWRISKLSIFAAKSKSSFVNGPFGSDLLTSELTDTGAPVIYIRDILNGRYQRKSTECVTKQKADKLEACKTIEGDVLLAKVGDPPCEAAVYEEREDAIVTQDVIRIRTGDINASHFLVQLLNSDIGKRQINRIKITGTRERVSLTDLKKLQLPMPPFAEQKKIASILSTWDKAIETVEKLIENSKAQKKALMQQLLTGKRRLPGFSETWREVQLKAIAKILISNVDKITSPDEKPVRLCNYTDVYYNDYITNSISFMEATAKPREIEKFKLLPSDVIITKDSETPEDIAIPAVVSEALNGVVCGYHLAIIRPQNRVANGVFLSKLLSAPAVRHYFFSLANGATRFGLTTDAIANAKLFVPELPEQQRIGEVLLSIDRGIENQAKQLDALKEQKKALMQQLLTGKRRVKVDEA